jgi:hypothetical protein
MRGESVPYPAQYVESGVKAGNRYDGRDPGGGSKDGA